MILGFDLTHLSSIRFINTVKLVEIQLALELGFS